jgi:hypothetical protein
VIAGIVIFPAYALMSYFIDRLIYRRFISKEAQKRSERESQRAGGQAGG